MPANLENPAVGTELEKVSVHSKEISFHSERKAMPKNVQSESESASLMSDSLRAHGLYSPWNSPGQHTGVGSLFLLRRTFPTQGLNQVSECSNCHTIALTSHASKVILKLPQASLHQYVNCEIPDVQAEFRKGRGTRDQIVNIRWIIEKAREFQKNIYFCFIDYAKAFDCVDQNKLWKSLKVGIPEHLTCLLRNLYAGQEATIRTRHKTTDWFQIGKEVCYSVYCHPAYLTSVQSTS